MSLNESQWRDLSSKNNESGLYDEPCEDELGVKKVARVHAGCVLPTPLRRIQTVAEYGSLKHGCSKRGDTFLNCSFLIRFRGFCVS